MAHENLAREQRIEASSDRAFGVVFAIVFLAIAMWPLLGSRAPRWWALAAAAALVALAWFRPGVLAWPNRQWVRLGLLLGRVVSPVALGILFFAVFTPVGLLMRLLGKDSLGLGRNSAARTYWRTRVPPGPAPDSMKNQF